LEDSEGNLETSRLTKSEAADNYELPFNALRYLGEALKKRAHDKKEAI
jgi:hypothetical protein